MPPNWRPGLAETKMNAIMKSRRLVPISPRGGLYLTAVSHCATERTGIALLYDISTRSSYPRFARLFRRTWFRVPRRARMRLLRYWRCESWPRHRTAYSPRIALLPDWPERPWDIDTVCVSGCQGGATDLFFWSPALNRMPDECASAAIAGGLARTLYWIHRYVDGRTHGLPKPRDREDWVRLTREQKRVTAPCEITVQKWIRRWGFSARAVEKWVKRDRLISALDVHVQALFRYPPALEIPADLARYRRMKPLPGFRFSQLPVYTE